MNPSYEQLEHDFWHLVEAIDMITAAEKLRTDGQCKKEQ
jgi:hypothetical protein